MPGSTPNLGLPYPLASEPFAIGNEGIQNLAEALDDWLSVAGTFSRSTDQTTSDGSPEAMVFDAAASDLAGGLFTLDGGSTGEDITYTGPDRWFHWSWGLDWESAPLDTGYVSGLFRRDSIATAGLDYFLQEAEWPAEGLSSAGLVFMETGSVWNLVVQQNTGSDKDVRPYLNLKGL